MVCASCGTENKAGARFCFHCGASLSLACPSCGTPYEPGHQFCQACGARLENGTAAAPAPSPAARAAPAPAPATAVPSAERRLVSILFVDLVGFTSASEKQDAEETRELLSRYFDMARTIIQRYGGTVEKFIGDAVMAVWGTPTATEDDAERAVRAALDLVASIPELDPALQARAAVLTGEAAVTIGAQGQGMVAGDLVNTASRVQSAAAPGTVVVGEATRRSTQASIAYEDLGEQQLRGKEEAVPLWRALRVVSGRGGALKTSTFEAPFVGRERELRLIKDMFHASAADRKAHLVSVTGIAGIGKSRLAWEFYKYIDGVIEKVWSHRGRSLAYGEGVAYWALADMVRMRCLIAEDDAPAAAREKLREALEKHVPDAEERTYIEPRLAQLIGLEEGRSTDRQDLFAAWRIFFERLALTAPVILTFEDMQWADASLLDFIEYMLEWSRGYPLFVLTLARPELIDKRPGWGAGQRSFTSLYLEPLSEQSMRQLLDGLVPGLPDGVVAQILARAQGVPLYAVETVRMLVDRGLLVADGAVFKPTGPIDTLEVPETLQALIAARLDGLSPHERRVLQDGAVLGKTFSRQAVATLGGCSEDEVEPLLSALVRKEVLSVQADPRSPERGQYAFLQDLVRHVAYESLARRDRKVRHLAAAEHIQQAYAQEEEVAEVLAAHYVAAYQAAPDAEDASAIRERAGVMLVHAGERAASLGAPEEGRLYYTQAADLEEDPTRRAELWELAGRLAGQAGHQSEARALLEHAMEARTAAADTRGMARVSAALADIDLDAGKLSEGIERLRQAVQGLVTESPNVEAGIALAQLGRLLVLAQQSSEGLPYLERALTIAEQLVLPEVFLGALISKALVLLNAGRDSEARILLEAAIERAGAEQLYGAALRATNNLAVLLERSDRPAEALGAAQRAADLARMRGDHRWENQMRTGSIIDQFLVGKWDDAMEAAELEDDELTETTRSAAIDHLWVRIERGELEASRAALDSTAESLRSSESAETRASIFAIEARLLRAEGRNHEALDMGRRGLHYTDVLGVHDGRVKRCLAEAAEAALALGELGVVDEMVGIATSLNPGQLTPYLRAYVERLSARLGIARGTEELAQEGFERAITIFRDHSYVFHQAVTQLELAEWLAGNGRAGDAEGPLGEAVATFEALRAQPWLDRAARLRLSKEQTAPA